MPKIDNWEDWDEVEEQTQRQQIKEITNGKAKRKKETNDDKKNRTNIKFNNR